jgi:hypothetical protein
MKITNGMNYHHIATNKTSKMINTFSTNLKGVIFVVSSVALIDFVEN